ncbi:MAG: hypothetical protein PF518_05110 [Spirochaetaceae bacterium]|jgi:hypothetical protein|nr:hypothetical protein [Spirochaetaceae bacterium]
MKPLLFFFFVFNSFSLYATDYMNIKNGVSFPDGIFSGIQLDTLNFSTLVNFNYSEDLLLLDKCYFKSDLISFGSVSFDGFLRDQKNADLHFFSFEEKSKAYINGEGNPRNTFGLIFSSTRYDLGISGFRNKEFSQLLFWKNSSFLNSSFINIRQSFSFLESREDPDSWYFDDYVLKSELQSNTGLSIIIGDSLLFGGCRLNLNNSPFDPPGFSLSALGGMTKWDLFIQSEIIVNSRYYTTADLQINSYPLIFSGRLFYEKPLFDIESKFHFNMGKEAFPGEWRLLAFQLDSDINFENNYWYISGGLIFKLFNDVSGSVLFSLLIEGSVKRDLGDFYIKARGKASYDDLFYYFLSLELGFENHLYEISLYPELEIEKKITMNGFIKGRILREKFNITASFSLENMGLYNCETLKIKPSFFFGIEIKQIL